MLGLVVPIVDDFGHVVEDEIVSVFHCSVDRLSVSLDKIVHSTNDIGSLWNLSWTNGSSIDGFNDLCLATVLEPVALKVIIEMLLAAISDVTVGAAGRTNYDGRI